MPKPTPRPESRDSPVTSETCVDTAYRLFSMKKVSGSFHAKSEVHGLEHRADVHGTVAEVRDGDVLRARFLLGPRVARREGHSSADNRIRAESPGLEPLQVHGAPAATAITLCEAQDLGQRALQNRLHGVGDENRGVERAVRDVVDGLGEELVVSAVRTGHGIRRRQPDDRSDRSALLADA